MSYQVLARKYRPATFGELIGQTHVSRALTHALDQDRLHHAYLFTGTRGVGKTTIARILARCLNCEQGVSSSPCGVCASCLEIAEGRFVDLIEVDAASRTKVEDTRELLENVQYAPVRGRYKVYLIDEVHMLSTHSFNALLKTLEEPPPHVIFLLATTDPQKLPVTVLSRCLQFSLKALPPQQVADHLHDLLEREMIAHETDALLALGKAAQGSMRDALSLTDQAIAFAGGRLTASEVHAMLGSVDRAQVTRLLEALVQADAGVLVAALDVVYEHNPDAVALLDELISGLHQLAVAQILPDRAGEPALAELARQFQAEQLQLYYDIALRGRRDLPLVPDCRAGLEMILLRMLLFRPDGVLTRDGGLPPAKKSSEPRPAAQDVAQSRDAATPVPQRPAQTTVAAAPQAPARSLPAGPGPVATTAPQEPSGIALGESPLAGTQQDDTQWWYDLAMDRQLPAPLRYLARNAMLVSRQGNVVALAVDSGHEALASKQQLAALAQALSQVTGTELTLTVAVQSGVTDTPEQRLQLQRNQQLQREKAALLAHPEVRQLQTLFDAEIDDASVQLLDEP